MSRQPGMWGRCRSGQGTSRRLACCTRRSERRSRKGVGGQGCKSSKRSGGRAVGHFTGGGESLSLGSQAQSAVKRLNESIFRSSSNNGLNSVCLSLSFAVSATSCLRMLTSCSCIGMSSGEITESDSCSSLRTPSVDEGRQRLHTTL